MPKIYYIEYDENWALRESKAAAQINDPRIIETINQNLAGIVLQNNLIGSNGNGRVPIRLENFEMPGFRYYNIEGAGQGKGNIGDVFKAVETEDEGERHFMVLCPLEQIVKMMFNGMKLPYLKIEEGNKTGRRDVDFVEISSHIGIIDRRRTAKINLEENIKKGVGPKIKDFRASDVRKRTFEYIPNEQERASVYLLMDKSQEMGEGKRYTAKCFFFWMTRFLRNKYNDVEIVFILNEDEATIVSEEAFFKGSEKEVKPKSHSAYQLVLNRINGPYSLQSSNKYIFYIADGTHSDEPIVKSLNAIKQLSNNATMIGYGELGYPQKKNWSSLHKALLSEEIRNFKALNIEIKDGVYPALQEFLKI